MNAKEDAEENIYIREFSLAVVRILEYINFHADAIVFKEV
jgi:hypothetical protein